MTTTNHRIYLGTETQMPDALIEAKQRTGNAPAYWGTAYVIFEDLPLRDYGNRVPQLTFEIVRSVGYEEGILTGLCIIPGATEFGSSAQLADCATTKVRAHKQNQRFRPLVFSSNPPLQVYKTCFSRVYC
jgi:hypothetical protein